jgi:hypothetical protein
MIIIFEKFLYVKFRRLRIGNMNNFFMEQLVAYY